MKEAKRFAAIFLLVGVEVVILRYCDSHWWHLAEQNAKAAEDQLASQCRAKYGVPKP